MLYLKLKLAQQIYYMLDNKIYAMVFQMPFITKLPHHSSWLAPILAINVLALFLQTVNLVYLGIIEFYQVEGVTVFQVFMIPEELFVKIVLRLYMDVSFAQVQQTVCNV